MNMVDNGQMDRGNENPTQPVLMIEENNEKNKSDWSALGFEPETSRIPVQCVITAPAH